MTKFNGNMTKIIKTSGATIVVAALLSALFACQKPEGPAEHAGKEIDKALEQAGQKIEQAGERLQDASKGEKKKSDPPQ